MSESINPGPPAGLGPVAAAGAAGLGIPKAGGGGGLGTPPKGDGAAGLGAAIPAMGLRGRQHEARLQPGALQQPQERLLPAF